MATTAISEEKGKVLGYMPQDTPPVGSMISLGVQQVLTMFPATVLVAILTKFDVATTLLASGLGTIANDDAAPALAINDVTLTEGDSGTTNAVFTVSLSAASTQTVTVQVSTSDGTATTGSDYTASTQTVTFAPGQTSKGVAFTIAGDTAPEGRRSLD